MTNYNHSEFLPQAIDAILNQSYPIHELIIIDDASTDNSINILEEYAQKHSSIKLHRNEKNMGILHNIDKLLKLSSGEYIYSAAADDKICPGFFEKSMQMLNKYPSAGLCSTLSYLIDRENNITGLVTKTILSGKPCYIDTKKAKKYLNRYANWIQGNTTIYNKNKLLDVGAFRQELQSYCDGFIASVIALKFGACFIPEPLASWRRLDEGFASIQEGNYNKLSNIINNAYNLMTTEYSEYFPKKYIRKWIDTQKYILLNMKLNEHSIDENIFNIVVKFLKHSPFSEDDIVYKNLNRLTQLYRKLLKYYLIYHLILKNGIFFILYKKAKFNLYKLKLSIRERQVKLLKC